MTSTARRSGGSRTPLRTRGWCSSSSSWISEAGLLVKPFAQYFQNFFGARRVDEVDRAQGLGIRLEHGIVHNIGNDRHSARKILTRANDEMEAIIGTQSNSGDQRVGFREAQSQAGVFKRGRRNHAISRAGKQLRV